VVLNAKCIVPPSVAMKGALSSTKTLWLLTAKGNFGRDRWRERVVEEVSEEWWDSRELVITSCVDHDSNCRKMPLFIPDRDDWLRLFSHRLERCFHSRFSFSGQCQGLWIDWERKNCTKKRINERSAITVHLCADEVSLMKNLQPNPGRPVILEILFFISVSNLIKATLAQLHLQNQLTLLRDCLNRSLPVQPFTAAELPAIAFDFSKPTFSVISSSCHSSA